MKNVLKIPSDGKFHTKSRDEFGIKIADPHYRAGHNGCVYTKTPPFC